eukprot:TRINITY_DN10238_c0_g1_i1.p1 TRINITY_DN10238_c0_g1~~TRINITY_DN10238_c0_g1_i1.p1  ORF type:complete len:300 (-),score=54.71 TRINITY_DN10238_c0_g1_i1:281-1180(-)
MKTISMILLFLFISYTMGSAIDHFFINYCITKDNPNVCARISSDTLTIKTIFNDSVIDIKPGVGRKYYWKTFFGDFKKIKFSTKFDIKNLVESDEFASADVIFDNVEGEIGGKSFNLNNVEIKVKMFRGMIEEIKIYKKEHYNPVASQIWYESWIKDNKRYDLKEKYKYMLQMLIDSNAKEFCNSISKDVLVQRVGKKDPFPWYNIEAMQSVFNQSSWRSIKIKKIEQLSESELFTWFETTVSERDRLADLMISEPIMKPEHSPKPIDTKILPAIFLTSKGVSEREVLRYRQYLEQRAI